MRGRDGVGTWLSATHSVCLFATLFVCQSLCLSGTHSVRLFAVRLRTRPTSWMARVWWCPCPSARRSWWRSR